MKVVIGGVPLTVVPMHGLLDLDHNMSIFTAHAEGGAASKVTTVVLATNMAESSITIPGVHTVIDLGAKREVRSRGGGFAACDAGRGCCCD